MVGMLVKTLVMSLVGETLFSLLVETTVVVLWTSGSLVTPLELRTSSLRSRCLMMMVAALVTSAVVEVLDLSCVGEVVSLMLAGTLVSSMVVWSLVSSLEVGGLPSRGLPSLCPAASVR